jgi:DNA-binding NarL/FixJ family response regulator
MGVYQVVLADDHVMFRQGLKRILEDTDGVEIVGEAGDGVELLSLLKRVNPEFVILDISMPNLSGIEALRKISALHPEVKVLMLTMHKDKDFLHQAIGAGAAGYILKEDADAEIFSALEAISQGQTYVSRLLARELTDDWAQMTREGQKTSVTEPLTTREREVIKLLAEGKSNKEIADLLFISIHTVVRHRANIMSKLKLKKTADLVRYAIQKGHI